MNASRRTRNLMTASFPTAAANESSLVINAGLFGSPATPKLSVEKPTTSLLERVRRGTGNDLILSALLATFFGFMMTLYLIPWAGIVLNAVALFLLVRVVMSRSTPTTGWIVCGAIVLVWNMGQLSLFALLLLVNLL